MVYTDEQLKKIKDTRYPKPTVNKVYLQKLSDSQSNIYNLDISFSISQDKNSRYLIYKNNLTADYKMDIFIHDDYSIVGDIKKIEEYQAFKVLNKKTIIPSTEYIFAGESVEDYIKDGVVTLNYRTSMQFNINSLGNLILGFIFYTDISEYAIKLQIPVQTIKKELMCGNIAHIPLLTQPSNADKYTDKYLDVSNGLLYNFSEYRELTDVRSNLKNVLNLDSIENLFLASKNKITLDDKYFSKVNFSFGGKYANLLFDFDLKKIINESLSSIEIYRQEIGFEDVWDEKSKYRIIINDDFKQKCKVSNLSILRKNKKTSQIVKIIDTTSSPDSFWLTPAFNQNGSIKQISLHNSNNINICFTDKTFFNDVNAEYIYSIEMTLVNPLKEIIQTSVTKLRNSLKQLENFLIMLDTPGYFNYQSGLPTNLFIEETNLYEEIIDSCIFNYIDGIQYLQKDISYGLRNSFMRALNKSTLTQKTLSFIITLYVKLIDQLNKYCESVNNNNILLTKNLGNYSQPLNGDYVGFYYMPEDIYFDFNEEPIEPSIPVISTTKLYNFFSGSLENTCKNVNITRDMSISFIPSRIATNKGIYSQREIIKNVNKATIDIYFQIKQFLMLYNSYNNFSLTPKKQYWIDIAKELLILNGINFDKDTDSLTFPIAELAFKQKEESPKKKRNLKQFLMMDFDDKSDNRKKNTYSISKEIDKNLVPHQVTSLIKNESKIINFRFSEERISVLKNMSIDLKYFLRDRPKEPDNTPITPRTPEELSSFSLFFNTIAYVEYCNISKNFDARLWKPLTIDDMTNFPENSNVLCRYVIYKNKNLGINKTDVTDLPIYDSYFILYKQDNSVNEAINIIEYLKRLKETFLKEYDKPDVAQTNSGSFNNNWLNTQFDGYLDKTDKELVNTLPPFFDRPREY